MEEEDHNTTRPPRIKESPPDSKYVYTAPLERFAGAALDVIFLHIILIPLRAPAADLSFTHSSIVPALAFTLLYFSFLLLILVKHGLTPGGLALKYRVVTRELGPIRVSQALKRLSPYIVIQAIGLWRLHVVLQSFAASGETYEFTETATIIREHGGIWNMLTIALNSYVFIDLLFVLQSPESQSLSDKLADSVVVSRSA